MKVVAILQARLGSTRLSNKMLLPLLGKPLVQHVLERVARATLVDDVVLAVPLKDAAEFAPLARGRAWLYRYSGDEADLVGRYLAAAEVQRADLIVRIPCDNPCVDPDYIDRAIDAYRWANVPFYSNTTAACDGRYLDGIGAEVFSISRLKLLDELTRGMPRYREHPHQYFEYPFPPAQIRLDVNTQADYDFITTIYDHFGHHHFTARQIVDYLQSKEVPHAPQERVQQESH